MPLPSKKSPPAPLLLLPLLLLPLLPWKPPSLPEPLMRLARSECELLSASRLPPPPAPPPEEVLEGSGTAEALLARLARAEPLWLPPLPTEGLKRDSVIGGAAAEMVLFVAVVTVVVAASMSERGRGVRTSGGVAGAAAAAAGGAAVVAGSAVAVVSEATRCSSSSSECLLLACVRLGEKSRAAVVRLDGVWMGIRIEKGKRRVEQKRGRSRREGVEREREKRPAAAPSPPRNNSIHDERVCALHALLFPFLHRP